MIFAGAKRSLRLAAARVHQLVGWAGLAGIAFLVGAGAVLGLSWPAHAELTRAVAGRPVTHRQARAPAQTAAPAPIAPHLPPASDIPLLLTQMKQAAASHGLNWRSAEYRVVASTASQPASLEVRSSVRGTYPSVRAMLVEQIATIPAFTLREFNATRPSADIAEIEVKLLLAVFLQDGASASDLMSRAGQ